MIIPFPLQEPTLNHEIFNVSFPDFAPSPDITLFPAKMRRSTIIPSSSSGNIVRAPFQPNFYRFLRSNFTDLVRVSFGQCLTKERFPSLTRRRAIFRLLAFSRHFYGAIFPLLVCFRIYSGILTSSNADLVAEEGAFPFVPCNCDSWHRRHPDGSFGLRHVM